MRGANGGSWYAVPFRIKPERGQVSEYVVQPSSKQRCDVFHDDESRSNLANNSGVLRPKARPGSGQSSALAGDADVLAGEPSADDIGKSSGSVKGPNVVVAGDVGPVLSEDGPAERVELDELDGAHPGSLKSEAEAPDAAEQVEDIHGT